MCTVVNYASIDARDIEDKLGEILQATVGSINWLSECAIERPTQLLNTSWDFLLAGKTPSGNFRLYVECKANLTPSQFLLGLVQREAPSSPQTGVTRVLGIPSISPRLAELCQQHGWSWYDLAGNCHLDVPGLFVIERTGRSPIKISKSNDRANLSTPETTRVVRALLAPENTRKRWTQRELVRHFEALQPPIPAPSLALVNKVVQFLRTQAFIKTFHRGGFELIDPRGLLAVWSSSYRFKRHKRRRYFSLLQGRVLHAKLHQLDPDGSGRALYASFSAADFQAAHVRQARTWLYVASEYEQEFCSHLQAKQVDTGDNIIVIIPEDPGVFYQPYRHSAHLACTNPVQTYVDVLQSGGRGTEAAQAIFDQCLSVAWSEAPPYV